MKAKTNTQNPFTEHDMKRTAGRPEAGAHWGSNAQRATEPDAGPTQLPKEAASKILRLRLA